MKGAASPCSTGRSRSTTSFSREDPVAHEICERSNASDAMYVYSILQFAIHPLLRLLDGMHLVAACLRSRRNDAVVCQAQCQLRLASSCCRGCNMRSIMPHSIASSAPMKKSLSITFSISSRLLSLVKCRWYIRLSWLRTRRISFACIAISLA